MEQKTQSGQLEYETIGSVRRGMRFEVKNPPAAGSRLKLHGGRVMTYRGTGVAGMLLCTDAEGIEQLLFPSEVIEVVA